MPESYRLNGPGQAKNSPLKTALWAVEVGLWPVPITPHDSKGTSPGKRPIGQQWGVDRPNAESIQATYARNPKAGVGLKLGADALVIDIDVDDPQSAGPALDRIFPGGLPTTLGWRNKEGRFHLLFRWDDRLAEIGKAIVKGFKTKDGQVKGNPHYLGLEVRIGAIPGGDKQYQTVIPPSLMANAAPRRWNDADAPILPAPESLILDLRRHAIDAPIELPPISNPKFRRDEPSQLDDRQALDKRIVAYLDRCDPAIEGQGGHAQTFKTTCKLGPGFDLAPEEALRYLIYHYNPRCQPPWSEAELRHKVDEAYRTETRRGWILHEGQAGHLGNGPHVKGRRPPSSKPAQPPEPEPRSTFTTPPPAVNEGPEDPHRLARIYLDERCSHPDGRTLVFHQGEFHRWDGAYSAYLEKDVRADLATSAKLEFDRINVEAIANHDGQGKPPRASRVTTGLVNNVTLALSGYTLISGKVESPAWLGDPKPWPASEVLPAANGLLHLPSFTAGKTAMIPPTPRFFCPYNIGYDFEPRASYPETWHEFLLKLWPDDPESVATLQEWFGYHLTPDVSHQKIGTLIGPKRSGKGTIARVLTAMIGQANVCNPTLSGLGTQFGSAVLIGKLAAIITDARISGRSDIAQIVENLLSISGEDGKTISRKHVADWTGKLMAKFTIISNETPRLADSSGALAGRMIILQLTRSFFGQEDRHLFNKLIPELPGILLWAIQGWKRLNARGFFIQPASGVPLVEEMEELSSPIGTFVRECCVVDPGREVIVTTLFNAWQEWCKESNRAWIGSKQDFGRDLRTVLPTLETGQDRRAGLGQRVRFYRGIDLLPPNF